MAFGLGQLRLSPDQFWAMTPRELDAALRGRFGVRAAPRYPARATMHDLMSRYPDAPLI